MSGARWAAPVKAAALIGVIACLGVPVNDFWRFACLLAAAVVVIGGVPSRDPRRLGGAVAVVAAVLLARGFLPVPMILEGHGVIPFTVGQPLPAAWRDSVGAQDIPAGVFDALQDDYEAAFPAARPLAVTGSPFAFAADGLFQHVGRGANAGAGAGTYAGAGTDTPSGSRWVTGISFSHRAAARLGVFNSIPYQFWSPAADGITREQLPYFISYRIPAAFAGSRLCWQGDVVWLEHADRLKPEQPAQGARTGVTGPTGRTQTPTDAATERHGTLVCRSLPAGKPVHILAFEVVPTRPLQIILAPPAEIRELAFLRGLLSVLGVLAIVGLSVRPRLPGLALPALTAVSSLAVAIIHAPDVLTGQILFEGGNDGLTYAGYARAILAAAVEGDWWTALRGEESVYYFMPGYRYVSAAAAALGGDTVYGVLAPVCLLPLLFHRLLRLLLPASWALSLYVVFLLVPAFEAFGFWNVYLVQLAVRGFGEPVAYGAFVAGLVLLLTPAGGPSDGVTPAGLPCTGESVAGNGGRGTALPPLAAVTAGGLSLALAVFIRPNLAPGTAVLALASCWWWGRNRSFDRCLVLALALAPILVMPLHNWVYGGMLVPFTASSTISANLGLRPQDAWQGLLAFAGGHLDSPAVAQLAEKLRHWVAPYEVWRQAALVAAVFVASSTRFAVPARIVAAVALAQQPVLFFYQSGGRYGHLTWSLTLLALIVTIHWFVTQRAGRRFAQRLYLPR